MRKTDQGTVASPPTAYEWVVSIATTVTPGSPQRHMTERTEAELTD